jgi:hypothetical protein
VTALLGAVVLYALTWAVLTHPGAIGAAIPRLQITYYRLLTRYWRSR